MNPGTLTEIEFAPGSRVQRDRAVRCDLPLVRNGPPATWIVFADGRGLGVPTDQILEFGDTAGAARVEFGGMRFEGLQDGYLVFRRVREVLPEEQLAPERGRLLKVQPTDVARVHVEGRAVWP
jgi:hypothetical protein